MDNWAWGDNLRPDRTETLTYSFNETSWTPVDILNCAGELLKLFYSTLEGTVFIENFSRNDNRRIQGCFFQLFSSYEQNIIVFSYFLFYSKG